LEVREEIVRRLARQIGREGGKAMSWVCSTASAGCSWWVCEAMEGEEALGAWRRPDLVLGSAGGWSWISGGGERNSWKREEEEVKENEMNFFFIILFFIYF
jgi:hypothetical protein